MIHDEDGSAVRHRTRADLPTRLREAAADRLPLTARSRTVPWRAAVVALVLAVVLGTAMLARAHAGGQDAEPVIPARAAGRPAGGSAAPPSAGDGRSFPPQSARPGSAGSVNPPGSPASVVVVHVTGRVRRPGLVRLPPGSRVWDAVSAAGGPGQGARTDRLNLARLLVDGEQVTVPGPGDPVPPAGAQAGAGSGAGSVAGSASGAGGPGPPALVDLNSATQADLDTLPGVGPVLAGRILAWRVQHGRFSRVEELGEVAGIGDKLLAQLIPLVRV